MNRKEYLQVSTTIDGNQNSTELELTEVSRNHLVDDKDVLSSGFEDEIGSDGSYGDSESYEDHENYVHRRSVERVDAATGHTRFSMELIEEHLLWNVYNRWEEPNFLSLLVTAFVLMPNLLLWIYGMYKFVGKLYAIWILVLHLQMRLFSSVWYIKATSTVSFEQRRSLRIVCSCVTLFEVVMCGLVYPYACKFVRNGFFHDIDGTIISEWTNETHFIKLGVLTGWLVVILRCCIGIPCLLVRIMRYMQPNLYREWRPTFWTPFGEEGTLTDKARYWLQSAFRFLNVAVFGVNFICIVSIVFHFTPLPSNLGLLMGHCDGLDDTECPLPFPSFHLMKPDATTPTGWRVDLKGMPPLRGGIPFKPKFLNELDGFSTMGPILFYMDGLKEGYENGDDRHGLQGPEHIADSITRKSITFLIDVNDRGLIPHSAEIDYLDPKHPIVMIFPAEPLKHNTHYAVAVISAKDENGLKLPRTKGMIKVMKSVDSSTRVRYVDTVIPSIEKALPWFTLKKEPGSLQLLFDFVTISAQSQLGPVRAARDIALDHVKKWDWADHARVVSVTNDDCSGDDASLIARTIHMSLDVPSFLVHESRYSFLDPKKIQREEDVTIGEAKALFQIPCSLMNRTLGKPGKELQAIVEVGHGLFGNRDEMKDSFFQKMGNDNGYITMAMDWRGMSSSDLPVVMKTLIAKPDLFQAVRDNLIQGFANKLCLQHYSQNGMLNLEVFQFEGKPIPTVRLGVISVFYGISQGGILGGGYVSLAGKTHLIHRGILGVPGTPFALVLTRSRDFAKYDKLLLLNFYNNRHVRILLGLTQMAWDSTEASGFQARPVQEHVPPLLLQAGLGDPVVPSIAAESLARAMYASTLPGNPRKIFGVPVQPESSMTVIGPSISISEILYEREYDSLPVENECAEPNDVHWCVRLDSAMIEQIEEFINTGRVIDPCRNDQCHRMEAIC